MSEHNDTWYPGSKDEKINERPNFFRRNLWAVISTGITIILAIALIVLLFRPTASTNSTPIPSPKSSPATQTTGGGTLTTPVGSTPATATLTQTPIVGTLCQYDATHSFSDWNNSPQWKQVNNGILGSDGSDSNEGPSNFIAWSGCKLSTPNYAVEAQIQYVRSTKNEFG